MNVFKAVRENGITARQAAERCGIKINRSGMAVCPFHKDKNPSMKIDRRYYCFGCGEKGDAIDFVAKFYGLGKKDAALQIASEFVSVLMITRAENRLQNINGSYRRSRGLRGRKKSVSVCFLTICAV
jgi:hypothetical protein